MSAAAPNTFHWSESERALQEFMGRTDLCADPERNRWLGPGVVVWLPPVMPMAADCWSVEHYLAALPAAPGPHLAIAMQAGVVALARFDRGEPVATKRFQRYVVRGNGRAQPLHLATKGKSRYGSRLRLQNAKLLLQETNGRLLEWHAELGPPERIFVSASVRLWPELWNVQPPPPFPRDEPVVGIPRDLPRPTTEVLLRAYRGLCHGRIERPGSGRPGEQPHGHSVCAGEPRSTKT